MSNFSHGRAAMLVAGDIDSFRDRITAMPASQLYAVGDELAAMIRHPVTQGLTAWRDKAGERISAIMVEAGRRWAEQWGHEDNRGLSDRLNLISELYA